MLSFLPGLILMGLVKAEPVEALELTWDAPPACPSTDEVRDEVRGLVAGAQNPQPTSVVAKISLLESGRWKLELVVENALVSGDRTLEAESCAELADATALVAAIAIDPFAAAPKRDDEPPKPAPVPEQAIASPAPVAPIPPREETPAFDTFWSVGAAGGAGWSSDVTGIVRLFGGWERRRLGVRFGTDVWLPRRYEDGDPIARGVSVTHALAHLRICFVPGWKTVAVPLCGGARAGVSVARAFGVQQGPARGSLASAALASVGVRWSPAQKTSPNLSLFFDAEPAAQLTRPRFHTTGRPPAYEGNVLAITLLAGAEVRFGVRS